MCLIALAWQVDPACDLLMAANRDEFHARPSAAAGWWQTPAGLFAGRDLQAGGTWCGVGRDGRFAAVTNVREPQATAGRCSRGLLVRDYFAEPRKAADWADWVVAHGDDFAPFNLLVGDDTDLWFVSNRGRVSQRALRPGVYAVSNGHWGARWPKTERAESRLQACLAGGETDADTLLALLADAEPAPPASLPDTGVDAERERFLSPLFIRGERYGTRATTVIRRHHGKCIDFHEIGFDSDANVDHRVDEHWQINKGTPA